MPHVAEQTASSQTPAIRCGLTCSCVFALVTLGLCAIVLGANLPIWLQPTAVGAAWGVLFAIGLYLGTVGQYQFISFAISLAVVCLTKYALQALTDLNGSECCLVVCVLTSAGWLASRPLDLSAHDRISQVPQRGRHAKPSRLLTWSIWDMTLLTTLVAICASSVGHINSSAAILSQIAIALCGGVIASWSACAWAMCDKWNLWRLAGMGLVGISSLGLAASHSPSQLSLLHIATWMLVGPLAVASAQGLTVLSIIALARLDAIPRTPKFGNLLFSNADRPEPSMFS